PCLPSPLTRDQCQRSRYHAEKWASSAYDGPLITVGVTQEVRCMFTTPFSMHIGITWSLRLRAAAYSLMPLSQRTLAARLGSLRLRLSVPQAQDLSQLGFRDPAQPFPESKSRV